MSDALVPKRADVVRVVRALGPGRQALVPGGQGRLRIGGWTVVPGPVGQTMAGGYGGQVPYQLVPGDGRPIALGAEAGPRLRPPHERQIRHEAEAPVVREVRRRVIELSAGETPMLSSAPQEGTTMAKAGRPKKGLPPREDRIVQLQGEVCIGASGWWYQWAQKDRSITDPDGATHVEKYIELTPLPSVRA